MMSYPEYQQLLRHDFVAFIERAFYELNPETSLVMAPYIELMASCLEDCRQGRTKRLIINIPPRYLKSHCASIAFAAWLLGHRPAAKVICASYGQDLANRFGMDCRKVMQSAWYQQLFQTRLAPEKQAAADFMTTQRGGRKATSVGGVLTGWGGDFIIIDDPLKPEDALSQSQREAVNNWFDSTLLSRLNDKTHGCIILIMQRLHTDDLVGHVMEQGEWTVLSFPAIAEVDEYREFDTVLGKRLYRRQEGHPLHAERESLESLRSTRSRMGDYNFACQYQQNPMPQEGAMLKAHWLQYYDALPSAYETRHRVQSWDTAVKTSDLHDYSVCTSWLVDKQGRYHLVEVFRAKLDFPDLKKAVREQHARFRPSKVVIEDKASGSSLIQELKREGLLGVQPYTPPAGQDKVMRLYAVTNLFEAGRVLLPRQASWLNDYRQELLGFPGARHDDQVDSTTQALDFMHNQQSSTLATWIKLGQM